MRRELIDRRAAYVVGLDRAGLEMALVRQITENVELAGMVAGYAAIGSEINVLPDVPLVYPRVAGRALPLTFHRCDCAELVPGAFHIPEPPHDAEQVDPDILLVPLLAVDNAGNRIGYGAGHYDRTLQTLRARRAVIAIGCAWDMQLVESLPPAPWDEPLDAVATPTRFLRLRGRLAQGFETSR